MNDNLTSSLEKVSLSHLIYRFLKVKIIIFYSLQNFIFKDLEHNMIELIDKNFVTNEIIQLLNEKISEKGDSSRFEELFKTLIQQIDAMNVIFHDLMKIEDDGKNENDQSRRNHKKFLLKQSVNLQKWISKIKSQRSLSKQNILSPMAKDCIRDLKVLKHKVQTSKANHNRSVSNNRKTVSNFFTPTPNEYELSKNDSLFVSPLISENTLFPKSYIGNKFISKKFSHQKATADVMFKKFLNNNEFQSTMKSELQIPEFSDPFSYISMQTSKNLAMQENHHKRRGKTNLLNSQRPNLSVGQPHNTTNEMEEPVGSMQSQYFKK